jgi:hypothetical protein
MRYDWVDPLWLDQTVVWLVAHQVHPYLLVEEWELPVVRARFPGQQALRRLDERPVFLHEGESGRVMLFDLADAKEGTAAPPTIVRQTDTTRSQSPIEMENLQLD